MLESFVLLSRKKYVFLAVLQTASAEKLVLQNYFVMSHHMLAVKNVCHIPPETLCVPPRDMCTTTTKHCFGRLAFA